MSKPNDWTKRVSTDRRTLQESTPTETKRRQQEYWAALADLLRDRDSPAKPQKPLPQHWTNMSIGRSIAHLVASMNTRERWIAVSLVLDSLDSKSHYSELLQQKDTLESAIGEALLWEELPRRKESRITLRRSGVDPMVESCWPDQHIWLATVLERFHRTFRPVVRNLDAERHRQSSAETPTGDEALVE